jgi:spore maturation protein CgeB
MPFVDGEHLRTWGDLNELTALIRHYISNTTEREQIASKGYQFVKENYTFDNMVKNLLKIYKA